MFKLFCNLEVNSLPKRFLTSVQLITKDVVVVVASWQLLITATSLIEAAMYSLLFRIAAKRKVEASKHC